MLYILSNLNSHIYCWIQNIMLRKQKNHRLEEDSFLSCLQNFHYGYKQSDYFREKLRQILSTLHQEIQQNQDIFNLQIKSLERKLEEKDSIINCLIKVNASLIQQNQTLKKKQSKSHQMYQRRLGTLKKDFQQQKQEMISVIHYLQSRNQQLVRRSEKNRKKQLCLSDQYPQVEEYNLEQLEYQTNGKTAEHTYSPGTSEFTRCSSRVKLFLKLQENDFNSCQEQRLKSLSSNFKHAKTLDSFEFPKICNLKKNAYSSKSEKKINKKLVFQ